MKSAFGLSNTEEFVFQASIRKFFRIYLTLWNSLWEEAMNNWLLEAMYLFGTWKALYKETTKGKTEYFFNINQHQQSSLPQCFWRGFCQRGSDVHNLTSLIMEKPFRPIATTVGNFIINKKCRWYNELFSFSPL